jgi:hypoxanthine phosphoribosyltransferase
MTYLAGLPAPGAVLHDRDTIARRVATLGDELSRDFAGSVPVLVAVLKGAAMFAADLTRHVTIEHELDFLAVSAPGDGTTAARAQITKDIQIAIQGRPVVLVEDVVDTGLTLRFIRRWIETHEPASIDVMTLLDRPHRRIIDDPVRYSGFVVPDTFLVGYGFDYQQQYRNLPDLHVLDIDADERERMFAS